MIELTTEITMSGTKAVSIIKLQDTELGHINLKVCSEDSDLSNVSASIYITTEEAVFLAEKLITFSEEVKELSRINKWEYKLVKVIMLRGAI